MRKEIFISVINNMRFERAGHYLFMLAFGVVLGYSRIIDGEASLSIQKIVFMCLSVLFAWFGAVNINDIYDKESDSLTNKKRPLVLKTLTGRQFIGLTCVYLVFSVVFAAVVSHQFLLLILAYQAIATVYSVPPLRLKKIGFPSKILIGMASAVLVLAGYSAYNPVKNLSEIPLKETLYFFTAFSISSNLIDLKDRKSDGMAGIKTLPVILGDRKAKQAIGVGIAFSYILTPIVFGRELWPFAIIWAILSAKTVTTMKTPDKHVILTYLLYTPLMLKTIIK